jgi:hypothetical protein
MNASPTDALATIAHGYATHWSSERPDPERVRPANPSELPQAPEGNEAFLFHWEILPDYAHCGINE